MRALQPDRYLGLVFHREEFTCWDLIRRAWLDVTGFDIGDRTPHPATPAAMRARFDAEESDFILLAGPVTPCIVLMRQRLAVPHVGLFWRGRVLHMRPAGVRYERLVDARRGFGQVSFHAAGPDHRQPAGPLHMGNG